MSVNTKLTAIADEVRTLSGTSEKLGLDEMATNLGDANDEVEIQEDLIAQIATVLEGKVGGNGRSVEVNVINPEGCSAYAVVEGDTYLTILQTGTSKIVGGAIFFDTSSYDWNISGSTYAMRQYYGVVIFDNGLTFTIANRDDIG